ncbi:MAG: hypothetical protein AAF645_13460, partial [Myxococcota bacterium]
VEPGACTPDVLECFPEPDATIPRLSNRCAADTLTCIMNCGAVGGAACQDACLAEDATPPDPDGNTCEDCLNNNNLACIIDNGCGDQFTAINDCSAANTCPDLACIEANCAAQIATFQTCAQGVAPAVCQPDINACFAPAG